MKRGAWYATPAMPAFLFLLPTVAGMWGGAMVPRPEMRAAWELARLILSCYLAGLFAVLVSRIMRR